MDINDTLSKIDWDMLREQKSQLINVIDFLEMAGGDEDMDHAEALAGILNLLDTIQDAAAEAGHPVKWLTQQSDPYEEDLRIIRKYDGN